MTTNAAARRTIINAWNTLLGIKEETEGMTSDQKAKIDASIEALKQEYLALSGLNADTSYAEITQKLTQAKEKFESIQEDRKRLKNKLVTAKKIFSALGAVIKLVG